MLSPHLTFLTDVDQHVAIGVRSVTSKVGIGRTAIHIALESAAIHIDTGVAIHTTSQIISCP